MAGLSDDQIRNRVLMALFSAGSGLFVIGLALWGNESSMQTPRWVVAALGGLFVLAGIAVVSQGRPLLSAITAALLVTLFGAVGTWVAFGPGERQFDASVGLPFLSLEGSSRELPGRLCFAPGAVILDLLALYLWVRLLRGEVE